jgi:hypothetical protein
MATVDWALFLSLNTENLFSIKHTALIKSFRERGLSKNAAWAKTEGVDS